MWKWIPVLTLLAMPMFAQRGGQGENMKAFRADLATAVSNGNLSAEEKQKYDAALKALDEQRAARESGQQTVDRQATRQAMQDLAAISRSKNLKAEDREKLAQHLKSARGKRGKRKAPAA